VQERGGPRPFDASTRALIEGDPEGWLAWLGLAVNGPVRPIDSDLSTVLASVDKVIRVEAPSPWLAHVELQVSRDPVLPLRLLQYHALLLHRHRIPVATTVVLLRRQARARGLNGRFVQRGPEGEVTVSFNYRVVRLWQRPVEELLTGGLGVLPLAPLAAIEPGRLPAVLDRLDARFEQEAPSPSAVDDLWAATLLLMGVRYDRGVILGLGQRVQRMRESVTYQIILEEGIEKGREEGLLRGEIEGMVHALIQVGTRRIGSPSPLTVDRLDAINDPDVVRRLLDGVLTTNSWDELLSTIGT
jgi:predicted transposase YdaD